MSSKKGKEKINYLIFLFLTTALIGGLFETLIVWALFNDFNIGGFMYGAWRPIYGLGGLLLYFATFKTKKNKLHVFISSFIICTFFEYIASVILELIFHRTWWNYAGYVLSINDRVSLAASLCWGFLGILFIHIEEKIKRAFYKVYNSKCRYIFICISILFIIDLYYSWQANL